MKLPFYIRLVSYRNFYKKFYIRYQVKIGTGVVLSFENELINEIHRILTSGTYDEHRYLDNGERPGEFKKHDYVTGINEIGSSPENVTSVIA